VLDMAWWCELFGRSCEGLTGMETLALAGLSTSLLLGGLGMTAAVVLGSLDRRRRRAALRDRARA
jgi:hypothetical protein